MTKKTSTNKIINQLGKNVSYSKKEEKINLAGFQGAFTNKQLCWSQMY